MKKRYNSFEEIDRDLMLLKLQADICREELRLTTHRTKADLEPKQLIQSFVGGYVRENLSNKLLSLGIDLIRNLRYRRSR